MLPILRIIPVGGVILAILIVVLALEPPGGPRPVLTPSHGALIAADEHPEWRQFLIQAAVRRADELSRLRELPDTPTRTGNPPEPAGKVAGLPGSRADSDPDDDQTGTITDVPSMTIPVDIGDTSVFELPVAAPEEKLPAVKIPRKAPRESRKQMPHRTVRHAKTKPKMTEPVAEFNLFDGLFGGLRTQQPAAQTAPQSAINRADTH
jgi:hypothetical protein